VVTSGSFVGNAVETIFRRRPIRSDPVQRSPAHHGGMADLLTAVAVVVFVAAMLGLVELLDRI
jgi:hypothetical protein